MLNVCDVNMCMPKNVCLSFLYSKPLVAAMRLAWEQRPVETETALEGSTREVPSLSSLLWGPFTGLEASVAALWQALCTCGLLSRLSHISVMSAGVMACHTWSSGQMSA